MEKNKDQHIALIPAKHHSSRCNNKNWRFFLDGSNLVDYLISNLPNNFFNSIILSTDKEDVEIEGVISHHRPKTLATISSPINDLITLIVEEYCLSNNSYLWLLNPTSPFRTETDFLQIQQIIANNKVESVVSVVEVNPFIWKENTNQKQPLFETNCPRQNTQDNKTKYYLENGQFYVFKVGFFLKKKTWYSENTELYVQRGLNAFVDIDTETDFKEAQIWGEQYGRRNS